MAQLDMTACILEGLPLSRSKLVDMGVDVLYIVIFSDKLACSDLSYAFHARYIVR